MSFPKSELPRMIEIYQVFSSNQLEDYIYAIKEELKRIKFKDRIKLGNKIAITAGSRGISHISEILALVVKEVKKVGAVPFLVPAMGSHGGASAEGQTKLLSDLGITPKTVGAPVLATMQVDCIGSLENCTPVYIDRNALEADGIIIVARVRPHTDFKDTIESGLIKMMVIGLGKQKGAEMIHHFKSEGYHSLLVEAGRLILNKIPIIFGLAIVENSNHEIAAVRAIKPINFEKEEAALLNFSKSILARIPFKEIDVLIVDVMGKDISGTGMDTNVIGRFWLPGEHEPLAPNISTIVVLDLTDETHGNALGIGLADITTKRLVSKIDYQSMYVNALTATQTIPAKIPIFLPNDRAAITAALHVSGPIDPSKVKIVRIKNTRDLDRMWISEGLYESMKDDLKFKNCIKVIGKMKEMQFDILGNLAR